MRDMIISWTLGLVSALVVFYISYWHQQTKALRTIYENDKSAILKAITVIEEFDKLLQNLAVSLRKEPDQIINEILQSKNIEEIKDKLNTWKKGMTITSTGVLFNILPGYLEEAITAISQISTSGWIVLREHNPELWNNFVIWRILAKSELGDLNKNRQFIIGVLAYTMLYPNEKLEDTLMAYSFQYLSIVHKYLLRNDIISRLREDIENFSFEDYKRIYSKTHGYKHFPFL